MQFPSFLKNFTKSQWLAIISVVFWGGLAWALHFMFEFSVLIGVNLPFYTIIAHFTGILAGVFIILRFGSKWKLPSTFIGFSGLMVLFFIVLVIFHMPWLVPIGLFGAGTCIGVNFGIYNTFLSIPKSDPRYFGRFLSIGFVLVALFIVIETIVDFIGNIWVYSIFFSSIFLLIALSVIRGRKEWQFPSQQPLNIRQYFRQKENLPNIALSFFSGFFFTIAYYATILIAKSIGALDSFNIFVIILFITFGIFALVAGLILDTVGRKFSTLIGISIQALAFLLLAFFNLTNILLFYIFPLILGIGMALSLIGTYVFFHEMPNRQHLRDNGSIFMFFLALGCIGGVVLGEMLQDVIILNPAYLTVLLLFILMIASLSISQLKETLPSKDELEWKDAVQYLYVLLRSGIPIYSQNLCELQDRNYCIDDSLLGGALVAVSSLLQEVSQNKKPLKLIKQEGFSILIEESEKIIVAVITMKDLKVIRQKLQEFLEEFQSFFRELIDEWPLDLRIFSPAKRIAEKHFS